MCVKIPFTETHSCSQLLLQGNREVSIMSWEDFGGPNNVDGEARRLAYMLNTGDRNAEHEAAVQLSQDLYGLPTQSQIDLVRRTQMYDARDLGGQLVVEPVYSQGRYGQLYDTGNREVKVVDPVNQVDDSVVVMRGTNAGYRSPDVRFDVFAGINDCHFNSTPWLNADWRTRELEQRYAWNRRHEEWNYYDGRHYGHDGFVRPSIGINIGIGNIDIHARLPLDTHRDHDHDHDHDHDRNRDRNRRRWDEHDHKK